MKRSFFVISFLIFAIITLSLVQIALFNRISTRGTLLSTLQTKIEVLDHENYLLSEKLLLQSSLTNIASNAGELGFVNSKSEISLNSPLPLSLRQ
ncbi:MAG: hypothetical protein M1450_03815 [Patescibacteria group bacterium]|nr:hypothetical protein [Patescibacteria group bacterium]